jgi:heme A synthase
VLATQIVLGGLTVLHLLAFWSVTLHLLAGNLFFALLLGVSIRLSPAPEPTPISGAVRGLAVATTAMWAVQMALGGLVSSNYAGLACTEWPTCNGGVWFPALDGIIGLQIVHRLGAYTLTALVIALRVVASADAQVRPAANLAVALVLLQVVVGVTNVLLAMPVELAIAHSAVGAAIGATLVVALWKLAPRPVAVREGSALAPRVAAEGA